MGRRRHFKFLLDSSTNQNFPKQYPSHTLLRQAIEGVDIIQKRLYQTLRAFNLKYTDAVLIGTKSSGKEEDSKYSAL
jgi:hypothetical protein